MHRAFLLLAASWLASGGIAQARLFHLYSPEELEAMASLICTGTVLSLTDTHAAQDSVYANVYPPTFHELVMQADVKVLHVFKGNAPAQITLAYRASDPTVPQIDGPMHLQLEVGKRYRFFLKPGDAPGRYVAVLDGKVDDAFAAEELWPAEPDDSPYLTKEEATRIARDYLETKHLENAVGWTEPRVSGPILGATDAAWRVSLARLEGEGKGNILVVVRGDRTVDPKQTRLNN